MERVLARAHFGPRGKPFFFEHLHLIISRPCLSIAAITHTHTIPKVIQQQTNRPYFEEEEEENNYYIVSSKYIRARNKIEIVFTHL